MIQLFNINTHTIDTSEFSNLLHDEVVIELENKFAQYVGAKYACSVNSATNAIITSGNEVRFYDDVDWVGHSYILHEFEDYKIVDSAQKLEPNQFMKECNPNDLMMFSFYPTKPLGGSDGGMIVTDDYEKYKWFKSAVLNGMTYADNNWERGISFPGYKFYMSSIQAKIIMNNFENFDKKMRSLGSLVDIYNKELGYENTSKHLYRIEVLDNEKFITNMKRVGIICGIHYSALHQNSIYNDDRRFLRLPNTEKLQKRTVSLPMNEKLSFNETEYIIDKVKENI